MTLKKGKEKRLRKLIQGCPQFCLDKNTIFPLTRMCTDTNDIAYPARNLLLLIKRDQNKDQAYHAKLKELCEHL